MTVIQHLGTAANAAVLTPDDDGEVNCRALYTITSGDVEVTPLDSDTAITMSSVPAFTYIPIACKFLGESTTATVVALY